MSELSHRMGSVNLIVAIESIRSIISKEGDALSEFHLPSIIAVAAALGAQNFCPLKTLNSFLSRREIPPLPRLVPFS